MREDELLRVLRRDGPQGAPVLAAALGVSQPTFSRLVNRAPDVVSGGRARSTRYAARRRILGVGAEEPVFVVDEAGAAVVVGTLQAVHPGFLFTAAAGRASETTFTPDLPWFLADLRPQGFLGRQVPRRHPELELPDDVRLWSSDHVLRFITRHGHDLVGHVVVGEAALRRVGDDAAASVDEDAYPGLADAALADGTPGSSAGGEQPKFLTRRRRDAAAVLVKFSPPTDTAVGRRVASLLVCEHLALQALRALGVATATTRVVVGGARGADRVFLEVERFDRRKGGGRSGVVSAAALDDAFVGSDRHAWPLTTRALLQQRRITADAHRLARVAQAFGAGIANSDMHLGNFSFTVDEQLRLSGVAPLYDMLPMLYAPVAGQLVERPPPPPFRLSPVDADIARDVEAAVAAFWAAVAADARVDDDLRRVAARPVAAST